MTSDNVKKKYDGRPLQYHNVIFSESSILYDRLKKTVSLIVALGYGLFNITIFLLLSTTSISYFLFGVA